MGRKEFMEQLAALLGDISPQEREEALDYYERYFDEAGDDLQQIRAGSWSWTTVDAFQSGDGIFYFHAFYQACNALCVSGTSADKVYMFDGVSVQFELNCLRTDTSCFIYLHFKYLLFFMRVRKYLSSHGARFPDALT